MKPGPAPKPTALHLVNGNPSKKSAHDLRSEIKPDVWMPSPPDRLPEVAKAEWNRLKPEMIRLGLITALDLRPFEKYCMAVARCEQAENKIVELGEAGLVDTTPSGYKQMSPWVQIVHRELDFILKFSEKFGFTPSARVGFIGYLSPQTTLPFDDNQQPDGTDKSHNAAARHFD